MAKKQEYGNESITSLKGADRVRKRPAVIFGSDGVEGMSLIHICSSGRAPPCQGGGSEFDPDRARTDDPQRDRLVL